MALVLFDIDGTLTKLGVVERFDYHRAAVKKHFDLDVRDGYVYRHGKTMRGIFSEFLEQKGISNPEKDSRFTPMLNDIGDIARAGLGNKKVPPIQNVESVLQALLEKGHTLGLLTGNSPSMAQLKLERAGLNHYFSSGAYGDTSRFRKDLVPIAIDDAQRVTGKKFSPEHVYVVGDTVGDVQCAKAMGAKSIAVATGPDSMETLQKENPDFLFKDYSDVPAFLKIIK
jgi:phosphoglycolate phosphatase-like HAD superfamily hydrolase